MGNSYMTDCTEPKYRNEVDALEDDFYWELRGFSCNPDESITFCHEITILQNSTV